MTSDRVSNERLAVAQALEEYALIDECEGGNPLVIATERRAAQLLRSPVTVSGEPVAYRVRRRDSEERWQYRTGPMPNPSDVWEEQPLYLRSREHPTHPGGDSRVVAYMHPTADWCHRDYGEVEAHCQKGGPYPTSLVTLSSLEAVERERDNWQKLATEDVEALQAIGEEFGILGGENRVAGVRRILTEQRASLAAAREALKQIAGVIPWQDSEMGFNDLARAAPAGSNGE